MKGKANEITGKSFCQSPWVYVSVLAVSIEWQRACRMVVQRRSGSRQSRPYEETAYYLSSVERNEADYFAVGIRGHWSIENRLHWVKDVQRGEDSYRLRPPVPARYSPFFVQWD